MGTPRTSFVGRAAVLADLGRVVGEAAAGRGGLVLVAGEPGVGKTTLMTELAERSPDVRVVWGSCWEGDGAPALWSWIQILRSLAREHGAASSADALARLVPELGPSVAQAESPLDEQARFRLFDATATYLEVAATSRPLLLVLDDLHWADTASVLLLAFLVPRLRASRIAIIGTFRDAEILADHPLQRLLGSRVSMVRLEGLDAREVAELVALLAPPAPIDAAGLHRATGGNPFFVREMLRTPDMGKVPASVGEVIRRRVARLSAGCCALLDAAAVIGQPVRLDVLERVADVAHLEEALAARLLDDPPEGHGHVRFPHAVVRESLYRDLAPAARMDLHRRVGEALEQLRGADAELAHHFARAATLGTTPKAIAYAARAGERALDVLAYEEAAIHFERAIALLGPNENVRKAELLFTLGRAHRAAGRTADAHTVFEQVAQLDPPPELLARTALAFAVEFTAGVVDVVEVRLLDQALAAVSIADHPLRARLLARLAKALLFTPAAARRVELSEEAAAMARRLGDPSTLAAVLYDRHVAIWGGPNAEERLAIANEVVDLAERAGDMELALQGRALRMGNLLELGDLVAMQGEIEAYDAMTARLRQPHYLWHVPLLRATTAAFACRFDAAEALAEEGLALGQLAQHQGVAVFYPAALSTIRFAQGRFGELEPMLRHGAEKWPSLATFRCALAFALTENGRDEEARHELERLVADGLVNVPRDFTWVANLALLALAAAAIGDRRAAALVYELLLPYRTYCVRITRIGVCGLGAVSHFLGVLAASLKRWDSAVEHLERAIETNQRIGAPSFVAASRAALASALEARGDRARAEDESRRAENAAATLGFRLLRPRLGARGIARANEADGAIEAVFLREGEYFSVRFRGATLHLKDSVGVSYLARLIASPGRDVHVLDLSGGRAAGADRGDAGPMLDARAKESYRRRVQELEETADEADAYGDLERARRAREELDALADELGRAVGLGGRDRRAGSALERARVRVTKAIKTAIGRIAEQDAALAEHLERSVRTGATCTYTPDPAIKITWRT